MHKAEKAGRGLPANAKYTEGARGGTQRRRKGTTRAATVNADRGQHTAEQGHATTQAHGHAAHKWHPHAACATPKPRAGGQGTSITPNLRTSEPAGRNPDTLPRPHPPQTTAQKTKHRPRARHPAPPPPNRASNSVHAPSRPQGRREPQKRGAQAPPPYFQKGGT